MQGVSITSPISDSQAAALLQRFPNIEQASLTDSYSSTAQIVRYMCRLVRHAKTDPVVAAAYAEARRRFPDLSPTEAIWWYAKFSVRFVHHQVLLRDWLGRTDELQLLISPEALLKMKHPKGPCAVFTCLICALLDCAGEKWDIVAAAVDPRQPGIFSHVYPRAIIEDGSRVVLDASHGRYPGWEVPARRVSRRQVFDTAGNPISEDRGSFFFRSKESIWD